MFKSSKKAFTMIELVFVIVVLGIIGKFGIEFLAQAYQTFIYSKTNSYLHSTSNTALEIISQRLQYRIKDSVIARESDGSFSGIAGYSAATAPILEWIGADIDGFRGDTNPFWSGIINLEESNVTALVSPETNTSAVNSLIDKLSDSNSDIDDAAIYFIGSDSDIQTGYGWNGTAITSQQNVVMHPINSGGSNTFTPKTSTGTFSNVEISEYYKLAWTAYAVGFESGDYNTTDMDGTLYLWYDYQPWNGENRNSTGAKKVILAKNVSTFQFVAVGSLIKIQICTNSDLLKNEGKEYSVCKEKTIY